MLLCLYVESTNQAEYSIISSAAVCVIDFQQKLPLYSKGGLAMSACCTCRSNDWYDWYEIPQCHCVVDFHQKLYLYFRGRQAYFNKHCRWCSYDNKGEVRVSQL